jgi:hypothetical protein
VDEVRDTVGYGRGWHRYYTEIPNELFDEKCTLTASQCVVYLYLLSRVNEERNGCTAWPSYKTIGKCTRMSDRSAITAIKVLAEKLYIFKKHRYNTNGQTSNMYLINHPSISIDWRVEG